MKYWTFPILIISLAQAACSGGSTGAGDNTLLNDPTIGGMDDPAGPDLAFEASNLMNDGGIGPTPNFWDCRLRQDDASVALESTYQFFTDLSGVSYFGSNTVTYSWDDTGANNGYIDLINDDGDIPAERWFVSMRSPTTFSAAIAYRQSQADLEQAKVTSTNANITCVLYTLDSAVNPDDEGLLDPFSDGAGAGNEITSVARTLLNLDSEFGLEGQLWQCIAIDDSLDLLLGFYPNGIGGIYNTLSGQLEGTQTTYDVTEIDGVGTVSIDAVLNNQADQIVLSSLIFERPNQFDARLQTTTDNIDVLISCNTLSTQELAL